MLFIVGICIISGTWETQFTPKFGHGSLWLKISQHLLVPATFNHRHLSPLPYRLGRFIGQRLMVKKIADRFLPFRLSAQACLVVVHCIVHFSQYHLLRCPLSSCHAKRMVCRSSTRNGCLRVESYWRPQLRKPGSRNPVLGS